jgi:hypothetical protein
MEAYVFMPEDTPAINKKECYLAGAKTFLVNGLITDCGRLVTEGQKIKGWFDVSTLKEPYRIEGKKTMGLELAEQFDWELPDVILYPTGGGTGLIGMWKAFAELDALGWLKGTLAPSLTVVAILIGLIFALLGFPTVLIALASGLGLLPLPHQLFLVLQRLPIAFPLHMIASRTSTVVP